MEKEYGVVTERVRSLLKAKDVPLDVAVQDSGLKKASISSYMNRQKDRVDINSKNLELLARYLDVSSDYLLGISDNAVAAIDIDDIKNTINIDGEAYANLRSLTNYHNDPLSDMLHDTDNLRVILKAIDEIIDIVSYPAHNNVDKNKQIKERKAEAVVALLDMIDNIAEK